MPIPFAMRKGRGTSGWQNPNYFEVLSRIEEIGVDSPSSIQAQLREEFQPQVQEETMSQRMNTLSHLGLYDKWTPDKDLEASRLLPEAKRMVKEWRQGENKKARALAFGYFFERDWMQAFLIIYLESEQLDLLESRTSMQDYMIGRLEKEGYKFQAFDGDTSSPNRTKIREIAHFLSPKFLDIFPERYKLNHRKIDEFAKLYSELGGVNLAELLEKSPINVEVSETAKKIKRGESKISENRFKEWEKRISEKYWNWHKENAGKRAMPIEILEKEICTSERDRSEFHTVLKILHGSNFLTLLRPRVTESSNEYKEYDLFDLFNCKKLRVNIVYGG